MIILGRNTYEDLVDTSGIFLDCYPKAIFIL